MIRRLPMVLAPVLAGALVASCSRADAGRAPSPGGNDPAVSAALAAPLMTDPDLASRSNRGAVLFGGGPPRIEIPSEPDSPDTAGQAKVEAQALAGGALVHVAAPVTSGTGGEPVEDLATAARVTLGLAPNCAETLSYTAAWATKLPGSLPIYPRGHVQEAAGSDGGGCNLRAVDFHTPVGVGDVVDFYYTRARAAGFQVRSGNLAGDRMVRGSKGAVRFAVLVRQSADGMTEADLIVTGG